MTASSHRFVLTFSLIAALQFAGCSSTSLTGSWSDPSAAPISDGTVLAAVITEDAALRRVAEDELVRLIGPERCTPSYELLDEADLEDTERAREKVSAAGFDYAVVMRPLSTREEKTWVADLGPSRYPNHYNSFYGYYDHGWRSAYRSGYMVVDRILRVETLLYSLREDRVIWAGSTDTLNPQDPVKVVHEIAAEAVKDLRRKGLIAKR